MIVSLRTAGAGINIHLVRSILIGLLQLNPEKFGKYLNFHVSPSWVKSLYQRMKFSHRPVKISRPAITRSLWIEANSQFLHDISDKVLLYNIPDNLIINADKHHPNHCVKSVQIRSFFWFVFSCIRTEYRDLLY